MSYLKKENDPPIRKYSAIADDKLTNLHSLELDGIDGGHVERKKKRVDASGRSAEGGSTKLKCGLKSFVLGLSMFVEWYYKSAYSQY